jgi:hypothetical protein
MKWTNTIGGKFKGPSLWAYRSLVLLGLVVAFNCNAQDLSNIGNAKPFTISGGINANSVFYHANGEQRRDPFNYFLSGNLNMSVYGWSVPVSFSYSNQEASFRQPFSRYGLSPSYKKITFHLGYRSMSFSNYSLNGHVFLGGGVDFTVTERIKVSACYGEFQKAVRLDTSNVNSVPAFQRMGGGVKVTLGSAKNNVDLILFKAVDQISSNADVLLNNEITPEENLVLGANVNLSVGERLVLKSEISTSALSSDVQADEVEAQNLYRKIDFAFRTRTSSWFYNAFKSSLTYSFSNVGVGIQYERIDPGYRTLGAYFFNNNFENTALTLSSVLFQKKLRFNGQFGLQRNNLNELELNTTQRLSSAAAINYQITEKLSVAINYSNFKTVINFRSQFDYLSRVTEYDNLDTLNYQQVAQTFSGNVNYSISKTKEKVQNVNVSMSTQKTADHQASVEQLSGSTFYNFNSSYSLSLTPIKLTFNTGLNANLSRALTITNKVIGPSASVRKTFFDKKISTNITFSYNSASTNNVRISQISSTRLSLNYNFKEKHQFDLSVTRSGRRALQSGNPMGYSELVIQVGYSYNFNVI